MISIPQVPKKTHLSRHSLRHQGQPLHGQRGKHGRREQLRLPEHVQRDQQATGTTTVATRTPGPRAVGGLGRGHIEPWDGDFVFAGPRAHGLGVKVLFDGFVGGDLMFLS